MRNRLRRSPYVTVVLLSAGLAAGLGLSIGGPRAQTAPAPQAEPAGALPFAEVPFYSEWASSPHANRSAEAFNHWNKEGKVPVECARCHSAPGFRDYLGADGSAAGVVDQPAPVGTVITCVACHNGKTVGLSSVTFPSGRKADNLGASAICMTCHQGVESTASVNKAVAGIGDDAVEPKLEFINVHYRAAGAMLYGGAAQVGYEYPGHSYAGRFQHQAPFTTCITCHELHTVEVRFGDCAHCHSGVTDKASLRHIRMQHVDYDGSGNTSKGLAEVIDAQRAKLLAAIMAYAKTVVGKPVVYNLDTYPYFFFDTNGNGVDDKDEVRFPNRYKAWTPRLLKAAYNYQFVTKDPGAYAHNSVYALQLLYDSLADLASKVNVDHAGKRP